MSLSAVCPGQLSWDLGLKSHPKDWRSLGSSPRPVIYKTSSFTTTLRKILSMLLSQSRKKKHYPIGTRTQNPPCEDSGHCDIGPHGWTVTLMYIRINLIGSYSPRYPDIYCIYLFITPVKCYPVPKFCDRFSLERLITSLRVKLVFVGVFIIFHLFSRLKQILWVLVRTASVGRV